MYRALIALIIASLCGCADNALPDKTIRVEITEDGRCLVEKSQMHCATLGQDLSASFPDNSLTIHIDVDSRAEYLVLASVLRSIREAGIERTRIITGD